MGNVPSHCECDNEYMNNMGTAKHHFSGYAAVKGLCRTTHSADKVRKACG